MDCAAGWLTKGDETDRGVTGRSGRLRLVADGQAKEVIVDLVQQDSGRHLNVSGAYISP